MILKAVRVDSPGKHDDHDSRRKEKERMKGEGWLEKGGGGEHGCEIKIRVAFRTARRAKMAGLHRFASRCAALPATLCNAVCNARLLCWLLGVLGDATRRTQRANTNTCSL